MRIGSVSASALILSAFALSACTGSGAPGLDSLNIVPPCSLNDPCPQPGVGGNDANGDGINDDEDGNDGTNDGGNTTNLSPLTADRTIALETSKYVIPNSDTSLSQLTAPAVVGMTTTDQILGVTKPTQLMIRIDTNSDSNGNWATPVQMTEHVPGTIAPDITGGGNGGTTACAPDCGYREYRIVDNTANAERNEVLQVWAWEDSYATQYRNATGGDAPQQAWSFGGNKADMSTAPASATYSGRFVATAKSENWLKPSGAVIDPNALWRVQGASQVNANFGTSAMTGTLTPETWQSLQPGVNGDYMWTVGTVGTGTEPDYSIYNATVSLKGTITGNTYSGATSLNQTFINTINDATDGGGISNPMYGGFFGAGATETTGVFHTLGVDPHPLGGSAGHNEDTFGYLTINGAFNGQRP